MSLTLNNIVIESRPVDKYINATQMCKAGGKEMNHWLSLVSTKRLIETLEETLKNEADSRKDSNPGISLHLIDVKRGGDSKLLNHGSWIHPDLAVPLAQWISPMFAIQVSRWIRELFLTGSVSIDSIKTNEDLNRMQVELQENRFLLEKKDETISELNESIFWLDVMRENKVSLQEFKTKVDGSYICFQKETLKKYSYDIKLGMTTDSVKKRTKSYGQASNTNNPFITRGYECYAGLERALETNMHALLMPFHIQNSNPDIRKNKTGPREIFQVHKQWIHRFIQKNIYHQEQLVADVNDYISFIKCYDNNLDNVNDELNDVFENELRQYNVSDLILKNVFEEDGLDNNRLESSEAFDDSKTVETDINLDFNFETHVLKVLGTLEKPLFIVKNICKIIGLSNSGDLLNNMPKKHIQIIKYDLGRGQRNTKALDASGLCLFVSRSNKPSAATFRDWLIDEILPSLEGRKNENKIKSLEDEIRNLKLKNKPSEF